MADKQSSKNGAGYPQNDTQPQSEIESPSVSSKESNENDIHLKTEKAATDASRL